VPSLGLKDGVEKWLAFGLSQENRQQHGCIDDH